MQVDLATIQTKNCCPSAAPLFPVFEGEYPDGVDLGELLDRADADMPKHFEWLCRNFINDIPTDKDYSGYKLRNKCSLVKTNSALKDKIGYDDLEKREQDLIDLYV